MISFKISHIQGFHQNLMFSLLTPLTLYGFILYDVQNTAINNSCSPLTCPAASVLTFRQQICLVNVLHNNSIDNLIHNNQEKPHEKKQRKRLSYPAHYSPVIVTGDKCCQLQRILFSATVRETFICTSKLLSSNAL